MANENASRTIDLSPESVWKATLDDLRGQMAQATFQWFSGAQFVGEEDGRYKIGVTNPLGRDWINQRLKPMVEATLSLIAERPCTVEIGMMDEYTSRPALVVNGNGANGGAAKVNGNGRIVPPPPEEPERERPFPVQEDGYGGNLTPEQRAEILDGIAERAGKNGVETAVDEDDEPEPMSGFGGFFPIDSNFTTCPDLFFDYVVPNAHGTVTKLVAAVIRQTVGTFEDKRRNRRREEWPINNSVLMRKAGIDSKTSLQVALWDAREDGYIVLRELDDLTERQNLNKKHGYQCRYALRIRYHDDDVDHPTEERPSYGNTKKERRSPRSSG